MPASIRRSILDGGTVILLIQRAKMSNSSQLTSQLTAALVLCVKVYNARPNPILSITYADDIYLVMLSIGRWRANDCSHALSQKCTKCLSCNYCLYYLD